VIVSRFLVILDPFHGSTAPGGLIANVCEKESEMTVARPRGWIIDRSFCDTSPADEKKRLCGRSNYRFCCQFLEWEGEKTYNGGDIMSATVGFAVVQPRPFREGMESDEEKKTPMNAKMKTRIAMR
jgi:hypothetical protein